MWLGTNLTPDRAQLRFHGIFYIDASNDSSALRDFLEISRVCHNDNHWENMRADERIRLTRAWLACQRNPWILIIDNANSEDVSLENFIPTGGPGTIIITTADEQLATYSDAFCKVEPMTDKDAVDLLLSYRQPGNNLDPRQLEAARFLAADLLGGHPLAVTQAGSCIFSKHCSYIEYCEQFKRSPEQSLSSYKPRLGLRNSQRQPVWKTFTLLLDQIKTSPESGSVQAIELLRTLCFFHHEGIQEHLFERPREGGADGLRKPGISPFRLNPPECGFRDEFEILCRYSLVSYSNTTSNSRQYCVPRLVHIICRESLSREEQDKYALRAISMLSSALSKIPTSLVSTWIDNPAGFSVQKTLLPHIKACTEGRIDTICHGDNDRDQKTRTRMILLLAKAFSATGHLQDARALLAAVCNMYKVSKMTETIYPAALEPMEQLAACEAQLGCHTMARDLRQRIFEKHEALNSDADTLCVAMMNFADSLWMTGKRNDALDMAQDVLKRRKRLFEPGDPRLLRTKRKVAEYLHGSNQQLLALELRAEILEEITREQSLAQSSTKDHIPEVETLNLLASQNALADSYQWSGNFREAMKLRKQVFAARYWILGHEHPDVLLAKDRLLSTQFSYCPLGKSKRQVKRERRQAVLRWKRVLGHNHPYTLEARVNLGHSYSAVGDKEKALREQKAVLEIRERQFEEEGIAGSVVGPLLSSMSNVANLLEKQGDFPAALPIREHALEIAAQYHEAGEPIVFKLRNYLADHYARQGEGAFHQVAMEKRRSILEDQREYLSQNDLSTLQTMRSLASDLERLGEVPEAIELLREVLAKQESVLGVLNRETRRTGMKLKALLGSQVENSGSEDEEVATSTTESSQSSHDSGAPTGPIMSEVYGTSTPNTGLTESDSASEGEARLKSVSLLSSAGSPPPHGLDEKVVADDKKGKAVTGDKSGKAVADGKEGKAVVGDKSGKAVADGKRNMLGWTRSRRGSHRSREESPSSSDKLHRFGEYGSEMSSGGFVSE